MGVRLNGIGPIKLNGYYILDFISVILNGYDVMSFGLTGFSLNGVRLFRFKPYRYKPNWFRPNGNKHLSPLTSCLLSDINECLSNPCQNGGTCFDGINQYTCVCLLGFTGTFCESGE